jgi:hypothetical protein
METEPKSFSDKLKSILSVAEMGLLAALVIGIVLKYTGFPGDILITASLAGLAGVCFLSAFSPPQPLSPEAKPLVSVELFMATTAPKILGIACAVSLIGIMNILTDPGNKGFIQLVLIGGVVLAAGVLIAGYGFISGARTAKGLLPMLYRAIPIGLADFYFFMQNA